jgi:uncharacterized membrane protein HdeD (DUF308 family)
MNTYFSLLRKSYMLIVVLGIDFYILITHYPFESDLNLYMIFGSIVCFSSLLFLVVYTHFYVNANKK